MKNCHHPPSFLGQVCLILTYIIKHILSYSIRDLIFIWGTTIEGTFRIFEGQSEVNGGIEE